MLGLCVLIVEIMNPLDSQGCHLTLAIALVGGGETDEYFEAQDVSINELRLHKYKLASTKNSSLMVYYLMTRR